ncbi:MAG: sn-glycerol-3-phosphate ABC transporter ATP-binding protein UgpC [Proteobacteria bacterium]|nr:sn-glycerol-3-phosphate ABC transporter ATP-binding protein UgpC [Pseudomonadota bacterium]
MAGIKVSQVKKSYGDIKFIHGVDCTIKDGEFLVIVGPSGCGKSTLLRMIAGLEEISEGEISIGDRVVNDLEPAERDIAMVFQNYALYPHMTAYQNMAYGLKLRRIPKKEIDERVKKAADMLNLDEELLSRSPRRLSGGQRQRIAMGRAIVREPSVFLFDEPLSNLDAKLRVQMCLEIKKMQQDLNITSIYVTHDQVEAMTMGDRLLVLNGGYVEQLGTPIDLYNKPESLFVAGFIGSPSMNFLDCKISKNGKKIEISEGEEIKCPAGCPESYYGKAVKFGIRPEHLVVKDKGKELLDVRVVAVEHLGADTLVHCQHGQATDDFTIRFRGHMEFTADENIKLQAPVDQIHLFDLDSGKRLEGI